MVLLVHRFYLDITYRWHFISGKAELRFYSPPFRAVEDHAAQAHTSISMYPDTEIGYQDPKMGYVNNLQVSTLVDEGGKKFSTGVLSTLTLTFCCSPDFTSKRLCQGHGDAGPKWVCNPHPCLNRTAWSPLVRGGDFFFCLKRIWSIRLWAAFTAETMWF
jgi:hypothetical protein